MPMRDFETQLSELPRERTWLLPALLLAQFAFGYVTDQAVERIARHLRVTANDIEGVATGYPELRRSPVGRNLVRVCTGLSCWTQGSDRLLADLEAQLGSKVGETAADGSVTIEATACCFICALGPAAEVNGEIRGRVTEHVAAELVRELRR